MPLSSFENLNIQPGAKLADFTTFKLGGPCKGLIHCQTPRELEKAVRQLISQKEKFILIGGGSNLVVSDEGVDCYVLRYVSSKPLVRREGDDLIASASTSLDALAQFALKEGLGGLNYCSGIPGTVGGAVLGNAGAFGKQVGDVLKSAKLISPQTGGAREVFCADLGFTYRDSQLKQTGDIVLEARFALSPGDKEALEKERAGILKIRHEKHPDLSLYPCAGSFFRNIEPTSQAGKRQAAGWFLQEAEGKNLKYGGAVIFEKHANIIIKSKDCTSQDVYELSKMMARLAKEKFNVDLVREVRFVGRFAGVLAPPLGMIW